MTAFTTGTVPVSSGADDQLLRFALRADATLCAGLGLFVAMASVGYTSGPICARLVAAAIRGEDPSMDIAPFSITRLEAGVAAAAASTFLEHAPSI